MPAGIPRKPSIMLNLAAEAGGKVSRVERLNARQARRVVELARLGHRPAMIASLLQLPPDLVE
jgi:hypothetical protein